MISADLRLISTQPFQLATIPLSITWLLRKKTLLKSGSMLPKVGHISCMPSAIPTYTSDHKLACYSLKQIHSHVSMYISSTCAQKSLAYWQANRLYSVMAIIGKFTLHAIRWDASNITANTASHTLVQAHLNHSAHAHAHAHRHTCSSPVYVRSCCMGKRFGIVQAIQL